MKKLLFISPSFPKNDSESYVIPFLQHVFLHFNEKYKTEIEITIIAIHRPIVKKNYFWNGIKIIPFRGNNLRYPLKFFFTIKAFYKIFRLIKKNKYNGILNLWYNEYSLFINFFNCKTFTWMLGQDVKKENLFLRYSKPNPKKIIALSAYNNKILFQSAAIYAHKIIPMAINETLFPVLNTDERKIDVFGAGNLTDLKNYKLFLEVVLELKKNNPKVKAEIAGSGEKELQLKQFVKENNLENNITFLGILLHKDTLEKMNNSKIFLHTSTFEGGSTVYFEALYSGCQLIGTLPMMDRAIENFHFHRSKTEICDKIIALLNNVPAPKRVTYYTMDYVCNEIYNLFYKNTL